MAEVTLAETPELAEVAVVWLKERLAELGAKELASGVGVAGAVEAAVKTFELPNGETIEVWGDNYAALSLSGATDLVEPIAAAFRQERVNG